MLLYKYKAAQLSGLPGVKSGRPFKVMLRFEAKLYFIASCLLKIFF